MKAALIFVNLFLVVAHGGTQDVVKELDRSRLSSCPSLSLTHLIQISQIDETDQMNQIDGRHLGNLSANPFDFDSTANQFGKGSPFAPNGINDSFSPYGSPYTSRSATNPFATEAPRLYDQEGNYRGKLSANPFDADSTSNQFGRYGSPFSGDSLNNPYGAGSPFRQDSPNNPYGKGWRIEGK